MTTKSIWIEIDSLHSNVLLGAINDGLMPNIGKVMKRGGAAKVGYEIPLQVAAWATAHTGLSVTEHGVIAFDKPIGGTYRMRIERRSIPSATTYWNFLGEMGKRVFVANSVNSILTPEINGIQLTDWGVHVLGRYRKPTSFPPDIVARLEREFPDELFSASDWGSAKFVDAERLVNSILSSLARKETAFSNLIDREHWDHVHIGLDELHSLGHVVWNAFEQNHPTHALVRRVLRRTDAAVGKLLDHAGSDVTVLLLVLGGIGPCNTWSHMVDEIIARFAQGKAQDRRVYSLLGRIWTMQPPWLTSRVHPLKTYLREYYLGAKRRRRRAYAMPLNEESGAIRINLRGREPDGVVEPGEEHKVLLRDLRDAFLELRDTESDLPLVSEFLLTSDLIISDAATSLAVPDALIVWNRQKQMDTVHSERLGRIDVDFRPARTGDHNVDGLVLSNRRLLAKTISVLDFAPTVAALHGIRGRERWHGSPFLEPHNLSARGRLPRKQDTERMTKID